MRRVEGVLEDPGGGAGPPVRCDTWLHKWAQVDGTYTGICAVEGRVSPAHEYVTVATANGVQSPTVVEVAPLFYDVRVNTVGVTVGSVSAVLVGLDARTGE